jgi:hypothetical protein
MRHLERDDPVGPQDAGEAGGEIEQVRCARQHIGCNHQVRAAVPYGDFHCGAGGEAGGLGGDPLIHGRGRGAVVGIESKDRDAGALEVAEQIAVVRPDLDDQGVTVQAQAFAHCLGEARGLLHAGCRGRRQECRRRGGGFRRDTRHLREVAVVADADVQRIGWRIWRAGGDGLGCQRHAAEVEQAALQPAATQTAAWLGRGRRADWSGGWSRVRSGRRGQQSAGFEDHGRGRPFPVAGKPGNGRSVHRT